MTPETPAAYAGYSTMAMLSNRSFLVMWEAAGGTEIVVATVTLGTRNNSGSSRPTAAAAPAKTPPPQLVPTPADHSHSATPCDDAASWGAKGDGKHNDTASLQVRGTIRANNPSLLVIRTGP